jgi:GT2 family glycosyltransferase/glycosyltransferase involved in cell wall biosynthesis
MTLAFQNGLAALRAAALPDARRWLEAARRQEPWNASVALALGSVMIRQQDRLAVDLHRQILADAPLNEALCGLAAALRMVGAHDQAAQARGRALSLFCASLSASQEAALGEYCRTVQAGGWCGLAPGGRLTIVIIDPRMRGDIDITLDGVSILTAALPMSQGSRLELELPEHWVAARTLGVQCSGHVILGHPIRVADIVRVEGLADTRDGDLHGWAWCPHDPEYEPVRTLCREGEMFGAPVIARAAATDIGHWRPLARPRAFTLTADMLRNVSGPIEIRARDGRNLYGSPLDPASWMQSAAFAARHAMSPRRSKAQALARSWPVTPMLPMPAALKGARPVGGDTAGRCAIVIPIHDAAEVTLRCLDSVLEDLPDWASIVVVDDASRDPALLDALDGLAAQNKIVLLRHANNAGFPSAVNTGLAFAAGQDVVLLNSDTLVPPAWLQRLRDAAYADGDIGTVTPLSNDATLVSYPDTEFPNPCPDYAQTCRLDQLASAAGDANAVDLPTAVGFCMFIKRDCLRDAGGFRSDVFAQGYGEENDFCLRARHLGWRHVAVPTIFVGHVGGQSFSGARFYLRARNLRILNELHPGYDAMIAAFIRADPLAAARRAIDRARWCAARDGRPSVLLITHGRRGGVQRHVQERAEALRREGIRPLCLWPATGRHGGRDCVLGDGPEGGTPNLRYSVGKELMAVAELLRDDAMARIEVHSLIGHDHNVMGLAGLLGVPYDMVLHDYATFCPRITLVTGGNRFCGEPDAAVCEDCVADYGSKIEEDVSIAYLRARSSAQLGSAQSVMVPSEDMSRRLRRHFPELKPLVKPWEDDDGLGRQQPDQISGGDTQRRRVCIIGAIGMEKGFEVLLACARDAHRRSLAMDYIVVGYTSDDGVLQKLGNVLITGEYDEREAVALIRRQRANCAFIPSIWPETWSYTLSRAWEAGLDPFAFDLGAPAARIRQRGWGHLLRPGMEAGEINDIFMAYGKQEKQALLF